MVLLSASISLLSELLVLDYPPALRRAGFAVAWMAWAASL
jgi:hypothetical protein